MTDFGLTGIESVTFAVTDIEAATRFATDWGLSGLDGTTFSTVDGSEVEFVVADTADPPRKPIGGDSGLCAVTWGVDEAHRLDALEHELGTDRPVVRSHDGSLRTTDDLGFGLAFQVRRRHHVEIPPTTVNQPGRPTRIDQRGPRYQQARPHEISHLAIAVDDAGAASRFYLDRLGFRVSDRYAERGVFMRCAPSGNHHNLFLLNGVQPGTRFGHLAFKVRDAHEVIAGGQAFSAKGWTTFAGPGRHLVSSANFWYFLTPFGGSWEYAADEDMVSESWEAADWAAEAHIFSEWTFGLEASDGRLRGPISQSQAIAKSTNT